MIRIQIGKQSHQQKDEDTLRFDLGGAKCGGAHFRSYFIQEHFEIYVYEFEVYFLFLAVAA